MTSSVVVQELPKTVEQRVELLRLNHRPRDDLEITAMELSNEVICLFLLDDRLELQTEPGGLLTILAWNYLQDLLFGYLISIRVYNILRNQSELIWEGREKDTDLDDNDEC